ncbi:iron-only hydrogenase maturation protein HydF [Thermodesulfobium acidiphilum]|uniref:Iron-only hydrogenase maturation protein HydF n=1 Tax=Thermodesulfobium acidiphilum TaxID=1794699 RepID=A0A2R4W128_THEAF|nr:[FeFe] hydrogenase H-cluster maturation GTPase HydF [Thermodesulfobium acidiphilum]AWB10388.1 iron-only hydrogenase maturation protein HydF [Thermodesulfobium acidiphilum]
MNKTPSGNRLHIALFGRTNVGKSSFLNMVIGQDLAITSPVPGTTTDVVQKAMELLPIGPVIFLDTAGLDDRSVLGTLRIEKTYNVLNRADIVLLLLEPNEWTDYEEHVLEEVKKRNIPIVAIINKIDLMKPSINFVNSLKSIFNEHIISVSSVDRINKDSYISALKKQIIDVCPVDFLQPPTLIGDLLSPGGLAILVVPIDLEAPKGRLILPQVQTIRDTLDNDAMALIVKERELSHAISTLNKKPDIVICDSQVVLKMVADTPEDVKATTFSILFSRYKGDLIEQAKGAAYIDALQPGDKILVAEACTHHPIEDDIGRVKIPRWLRQYVGGDLQIDVYSGRDYPDNLSSYKLVIHCAGCVLNRREMLSRIQIAREAKVPITNYGIAISFLQGVLKRTLDPFPAALMAFKNERKRLKTL